MNNKASMLFMMHTHISNLLFVTDTYTHISHSLQICTCHVHYAFPQVSQVLSVSVIAAGHLSSDQSQLCKTFKRGWPWQFAWL